VKSASLHGEALGSSLALAPPARRALKSLPEGAAEMRRIVAPTRSVRAGFDAPSSSMIAASAELRW
jgi:hypothetical protein